MQISNELKKIFQNVKRVCILTGAGISAESGVPTFRGGGNSAVWKGMPFDQISSARMVRENLSEVWEWFDYRRGVLAKCQPNAAHFALAGWQDKFEDFTLVTQNVDGLHTRAGSREILELHGNINRSYCTNCAKKFQMKAEDVPHKPEICDECGEKVRPDVVLFGELLPVDAFRKAEQKARECDLFFVVGTSALVYPAAGLAEIAKFSGAYLVEINPEETPMTRFCDEILRGKAGEILPILDFGF
ncbi:MAG TPA: NAD-dependent deacylase [Pyrinomonadaceae bacterium]|nr:NAD-dependent deacylase [Pyrinomonadaceae bacterium]